MNTFLTLLKREYWEHKTGFQWVPIGVATLALFTTLLAVLFLTNESVKVSIGAQNPTDLLGIWEATADDDSKSMAMTAWYYSNILNLVVVMGFVGYFYCLGALYDDRKDKSILFWKSLPVSDSLTVLSKVASVCLVLPLITAAISLLSNIGMMLVGLLFAVMSDVNVAGMVFSPLNILTASGYQLISSFIAVMWAFPFIGYLLFVSSATKKVPFLVSWLPLLVVFIVEGIAFKSSNLLGWIGQHFAGIGKAYTVPYLAMTEKKRDDYEFMEIFDKLGVEFDGGWTSFANQLANSDLWIGLVVGGLFIAGAIYIRRFRDEAL